MEPSDLPLMVPIQATVMNMFRDSIGELEIQKQKLAEEDSGKLKAKLKDFDPTGDGEPGNGAAGQIPPLATGKGKAQAKPAKKGGAQQTAAAQKDAQPEASGEAEKQEKEAKAQKELDEELKADVWRSEVNTCEANTQSFLSTCEPHYQWMKNRLDFLSAKPSNEYMIEDILGEWIEPVELPSSCIDAVALAKEHTAKLSKVYGYKPPRGLHEVGKVTPRDTSIEANQTKMFTHSAGGVGMELEFACTGHKQPSPPKSEKRSSQNLSQGRRSRARGDSDSEAEIEGAEGFAMMQQKSKKDGMSLKKSKVPSVVVELSSTQLHFPECEPGTTYEQRLIVWNRDYHARRIKISPSPSALLEFRPATKNYDPDRPIVPGKPVEFKIWYTPHEALDYQGWFQIGHAREENRSKSEESLASQWTFVDVEVTATSMAPKLTFSAPLSFSPCFVFSSIDLTVTVSNNGCAGIFSLIPPKDSFTAKPNYFKLEAAESIDVTFTFHPCREGRFDEALVVEAVLAVDLSQKGEQHCDSFPLNALAAVPLVYVESFGTAEFSVPSNRDEAHLHVPLGVMEDACVTFTSQKHVCVRNTSPLPIPYYWRHEERGSSTVEILPEYGVLPPERTTVFSVEVTPQTTESIECLCALMLKGLPAYPAEYESIYDDLAIGAMKIPELRRGKVAPSLMEKQYMETDPFQVFATSPEKAVQSKNAVKPTGEGEEQSDVFCCAVRLAADPIELAAHLAPNEIKTDIPCLIQQPNIREFTLVNDCNTDLHFWLDPPQGDEHPGANLDAEAKKRQAKKLKKLKELFGPNYVLPLGQIREDIELAFNPHRGIVPGNSAVTVTLSFTMKEVGQKYLELECYMPQLRNNGPKLILDLEARGPTIHCSTNFIDFGIIPLGGEAESRLTLSNFNAIPLTWTMVDPNQEYVTTSQSVARSMSQRQATHEEQVDGGNVLCFDGGQDELPSAKFQDAPLVEEVEGEEEDDTTRFVFVPETGPLKPREEVPVTVYLRGISVGDVQDRIEVQIQNGETKFVEIRACIQEPKATISPAAINYGFVDRDIPQLMEVKLANLSSIDVEFSFEKVEVPEGMTIKFLQPTGVLVAGIADVPYLIETTFHGTRPARALVALTSPQLKDPLPLEIKCEQIKQVSIGVHVTTEAAIIPGAKNPGGVVGDGMSIRPFVESLLQNCVSNALGDFETKIKPFCHSIELLNCEIQDTMPYCTGTAIIAVENFSGCNSKVALAANRYAPLFPGEGTLTSTCAASALKGEVTEGGKPGGAFDQTAGKKKKTIALDATQAAFQCKMQDGRNVAENELQAQLDRTRKLLLDGKGLALELKNASGPLPGGDKHSVQCTVYSNLPGVYKDTVSITCEGLPKLSLDVNVVVKGKPILIDPFTAGLTSGKDGNSIPRLVLPALVGGMSSVKRKLRVTSRCPRDLKVYFSLIESNSFFGCSMHDTGSDEAPFDLQLIPSRFNVATHGTTASGSGGVTPSEILIPALQTEEISVEYKPPPGTMGQWKATLVIQGEIAETLYNDKFLVDEYYQLNKHLYPASRTIAAEHLVASGNIHGELKGVPKIFVRTPLVDRIGVVKDSVLIVPKESELMIAGASPGKNQSEPNSDSEDESEQADPEFVKRQRFLRQQLATQAQERQLLKDFLERKRKEQTASSVKYFLPSSIDIVATNVAAKIITDPPEIIRLPQCAVGAANTRVVHLNNEHVTPFDFRVEVEGPFVIDSTKFVPHRGAKSTSGVQLQQQEKQLTLMTASAKGLDITPMLATGKSGKGASKAQPPGENTVHYETGPSPALFQLKPLDQLKVGIKLNEIASTSGKNQVKGVFKMIYANSAVQKMDILATIHVPTLVPEPSLVHFRPSLTVENGRPQPKYVKELFLLNHSICDAPFEIRHFPSDRPISRGGEILSRAQRAQQAVIAKSPEKRKQLQENVGPAATELQSLFKVDEASRFDMSPTVGVVPAASAGGVPGKCKIQIQFLEHASTSFESTFEVVVDGGVGCQFSLQGDSKQTEL